MKCLIHNFLCFHERAEEKDTHTHTPLLDLRSPTALTETACPHVFYRIKFVKSIHRPGKHRNNVRGLGFEQIEVKLLVKSAWCLGLKI